MDGRIVVGKRDGIDAAAGLLIGIFSAAGDIPFTCGRGCNRGEIVPGEGPGEGPWTTYLAVAEATEFKARSGASGVIAPPVEMRVEC